MAKHQACRHKLFPEIAGERVAVGRCVNPRWEGVAHSDSHLQDGT